ncbi:MAG TPA: CRISPR-associated helicase Cas3' [Syntrophales bacterium]|nr:CRISPR-associated helicase Cas3' [Syntrophales bacterium]HOR31994.1 CRISPR-associated helicase Cas3' [Syntrophales bacterium]HQC23558.1 CRISPR-associated helicase Cas3' [Syntrophales bacterium]
MDEHLRNVAQLSRAFANDFDAGRWAYFAGLWHDLGKYSDVFQGMLLSTADPETNSETRIGRPDHSTAGAQHAFSNAGRGGKILAYAIAGHHAGLLDGKGSDGSLEKRLKKVIPDFSAAPASILNSEKFDNLPFAPDAKHFSFQAAFFIRMVFSCLVDADFLDTECFMEPSRTASRKGYPTLVELQSKLDSALDAKTETAVLTPINERRAGILKLCRAAASWKPGLFSLTVPTGGGKTLSSLAFALRHALIHGLKRVIYVIPYTSIIEQTASVFRDVLGDDAVLEHHSNFEPAEDDQRSRLASENWDAPVIVTTNVQFFESLFAAKTSRCRRLHNIVRSVVILDEAQMLPVHLLRPCIESLRELSRKHYGTSIVLCTATQPALSSSEYFKDGLNDVREIIPDPAGLYREFKRVEVQNLGTLADDMLVHRINEENQVLCIVNTRKHARVLYECIEAQQAYHLSGLMCPEHRSRVLREIKTVLESGSPCRLISTQLVEAGVDVDFPVVYRAATGVDSLAQAAGRCNREGRMTGTGRVFLFTPAEGLPAGHFRQTAETAEMVLRQHDDPLSLRAVEDYFRHFYWLRCEHLDSGQILTTLAEGARNGDFPFRTIADRFRLIEQYNEPLIIPHDPEAARMVRALRYAESHGRLARALQRYTIQIPRDALARLLHAGSVERLHDQFNILINGDLYRDDLGLCPKDPQFHKIESLIA